MDDKDRIHIVVDKRLKEDFIKKLSERGFKKGDFSEEIERLMKENLNKISKEPIYTEDNIEVDKETKEQIELFYDKINTYEKEIGRGLFVLKDEKSGAFYTECHISAKELVDRRDLFAHVNPDPEEQEEYFKMNRDIQKNHPSYKKMISDAKEGRQFSDLVMEFNVSYKPQNPLKILGGQHRVLAIEEALSQKNINKIHGIRVYFNLNVDTRIEIADIANTNINLSLDLRDRMYEEGLTPPGKLMEWCRKIGVLGEKENFSERRLKKQDRPTVRMMRAFIVNFYEGKNYKKRIDENPVVPELPVQGGMDSKYEEIYKKLKGDFIHEKDLTEAGLQFIKLHKKQVKTAPEEYKYRIMNLALIASWAFVAGNLQKNKDKKELNKLYNIPTLSGNRDPLNSEQMDKARNDSDPINYRMGVRFGEKERGRLTQFFYRYASSDKLSYPNLRAYNEAIRRYDLLKGSEQLTQSQSAF